MAGKNKSVLGIYPDRLGADEATATLQGAGFRNTDISILLQENEGTKDFGHERSTKAPEGAVAGGIIGAIIGGVLGWLIGMGTLTVPGLDKLVAAGPVVAALAGLGALGAVVAIIGALIGLGTPEYEAKRYGGRIKRGGVLLSVHCDSDTWEKRAKELLRQTGAEGIGCAAESGADFSISDRPMPRARKARYSEAPPATPDEVTREEIEPSRRS